MLYNIERPNRFDDMKGQTEVVTNIRNQSKQNKFFHIYILGGQFGSGKTTMARIIALASNCNHKDENGNPCLRCESCKLILNTQTTDVIEMDGASNTGVDAIRDLKETVSYMPSDLKYKIYIIDEVHMLSKGAFNSLLKVLEEPPEYAIFVLCTTEVKAIPATVRSRAANYNFGQIGYDVLVEHLSSTAKKHQIQINDDAIALIAKNSSGAMRNALSLLEQVAESDTVIVADTVSNMLGISDPVHIFKLLSHLLDSDTANCINSIESIVASGKDLFLLVSDMLDICADGVVACCSSMEHICNTEQYKEQLSVLVKRSNKEQFCTIATALISIRDELRKMPSKTTLIVGIIRITHDVELTSSRTLSRLAEIEKLIKEQNFECFHAEVTQSSNTCEVQEEISISPAAEINHDEHDDAVKKDFNEVSVNKNDNVSDKVIDIEQKKVLDTNTSEIKETSEDVIAEEEITEKVKSEDKAQNEFETLDMFDLLDLYGGLSMDKTKMGDCNKDDNETDTTNELKNNNDVESTHSLQENNSEIVNRKLQSELEQVMVILNTCYQDEPILENAIELGCEKTVTDDGVVLTTTIEPIYKLVLKYIEVFDLPLEIQYID